MKFQEIRQNLFFMSGQYYLAHCLSADLELNLSKGISASMNHQFNIIDNILKDNQIVHAPSCILTGKIFNLITKKRFNEKSSYDDLYTCLILMKEQIEKLNIKKLAMPKIGNGVEGLDWAKVSEKIKEIFSEINIEIVVCYK